MEALRLGDVELELGEVTYVMGVINASPDSKNLHTVVSGVDEALQMAGNYRRWGATLIDLGGQSSHYDNETIAAADEISRVVPIIDALTAEDHLVAIDTWKTEVASAALDSGAVLVNDTGGLQDPEMRSLVARYDAAAVAVYIEGENPHDVGDIQISADKAERTARALASVIEEMASLGVDQVIVDPGIALNYRGDYEAYTRMQLEVIANTADLRSLGKPVLIPIPRKRDFHRMLAYVSLALEHKADLIRVHDVAVACDLADLFGRAHISQKHR